MKKISSLKVSVSNMKDISKITKDTKYINIDITNCDYEVIKYLLEHGKNYLYTSAISNINGYIYVSYEEFLKAENLISIIYKDMPKNLTELEIARYLYTSIAKYISSDINMDETKNEICNMLLVSNSNNLWGSLSSGKANKISASKIYYYLCRRIDIETNIILKEDTKEIINELYIDNQVITTNLFKDLPYLEANMKTKFFTPYNDDYEMDKKIHYIKNKYNDDYLDKALKHIDYMKEDCVYEILNKVEKILPVSSIKPTSLSIIFSNIFHEYCPNYNIKINNLFLQNKERKHFIMISYNEDHYSYNYKFKGFVKINNKEIIRNLKIGKIGIYLDECIPNIKIN